MSVLLFCRFAILLKLTREEIFCLPQFSMYRVYTSFLSQDFVMFFLLLESFSASQDVSKEL